VVLLRFKASMIVAYQTFSRLHNFVTQLKQKLFLEPYRNMHLSLMLTLLILHEHITFFDALIRRKIYSHWLQVLLRFNTGFSEVKRVRGLLFGPIWRRASFRDCGCTKLVS